MTTNIEWVQNDKGERGITKNSKTGCLNHVDGLCLGGSFPCYAHRTAFGRVKFKYLANRRIVYPYDFAPNYLFDDPFYPRRWPERLDKIRRIRKPTGIFLDDMSDWMAPYWPEEWTRAELQTMRDCPQHRFYTLTKQPQELPKWSPFPDNCWVGATVTNNDLYRKAMYGLYKSEAKIKFISFEPLLENISALNTLDFVDWLIIGACTGTKTEMEALIQRYPELTLMQYGKRWTAQPRIEWMQEIMEAADKAGIPVFLKDNLKPLSIKNKQLFYTKPIKDGIELLPTLRQEMPSCL